MTDRSFDGVLVDHRNGDTTLFLVYLLLTPHVLFLTIGRNDEIK
jgi:hypothetical protein